MSIEMKQEGLFQDPLGSRLKVAREAFGLSPEGAAKQLRIPTVIVEAMEREDWQRLGAPIYVRAHLSAYLGLLELPAALVEGPVSQKPAPRLAAMDSRSRLQGILEKGARHAVYLVMTAGIVIPLIWLAAHYDTGQKLVAAISLEPDTVIGVDLPASGVDAAEQHRAQALSNAGSASRGPEPDGEHRAGDPGLSRVAERKGGHAVSALAVPMPVVASLAAFPPAGNDQAAPPATGLLLKFQGDSWLEVVAEDGSRLEWGLISAGEQRRFPAGRTLKITVGNAEAVTVTHDGQPLDLAPYRSANVARFAVSSASDVIPTGQ